MKIRIISEKKISPMSMRFPLQHPDFFDLQAASTNTAATNDGLLSVFMHYEAYQKIWEHVQLDSHNELGGAVLGYYGSDNGNDFIMITDVFNQPPEYFASPTLLRFTSQFYDDLEEYIDQIEAQHTGILRLGLYHTHPNYGVFLSRTDAQTFKGIFKDPFQIAMVVDPVRKEDGVFFWIGSELSKCTGYRLYNTQNPNFKLHRTRTRNPLAAKYNTHLQLDSQNQIVPKIQVYESHQSFDAPQRIEKQGFLQTTESDNPKPTNTPIIKHRIDKPLYIPRACLLYDMHYRNREIRLYRYFIPLQKSPHLEKYPYQVFIHRNISKAILSALKQKQDAFGFLRGNLHYDKQQNLYFVDAYAGIEGEGKADLQPFNAIGQQIVANRKQGTKDILGWFFASQKPYQDVFRFTNMHRKLFKRSHHFGIVLRTKTIFDQEEETSKMVLDVENAYIVAYNFDKNIPFDYFKNLFLYEKPY
ncbi:MAG: Mov34/MPN/PAD-1 family protein [Chitinophagales bacterium]